MCFQGSWQHRVNQHNWQRRLKTGQIYLGSWFEGTQFIMVGRHHTITSCLSLRTSKERESRLEPGLGYKLQALSLWPYIYPPVSLVSPRFCSLTGQRLQLGTKSLHA